MAKKEEKTNVARILDQKHIAYKYYSYECGDVAPSGVEVANLLGFPVEKVFKTLVTAGKSGNNYVFVIPVAKELDLKAAAKAVSEKNIEMIKSKDLLGLTGYIHGGCSPIGMKRFFTTVLDESAKGFDSIIFSAGKIGNQVELAPTDLEKVIRLSYSKLTD